VKQSRRIRQYIYDLTTKIRYGRYAPLKYQTLYVNPAGIAGIARESFIRQTGSTPESYPAIMVDGDWDLEVSELWPSDFLESSERVFRRVRFGQTWEELGVYDFFMGEIQRTGKVDRCQSLGDLEHRYQTLDKLIEEVKRVGFMRRQQEVHPTPFREKGGVGVFITRTGRVVFAGSGHHRLGIALGLGLSVIPVCVLAVHSKAMTNRRWHARKRLSNKLKNQYYQTRLAYTGVANCV